MILSIQSHVAYGYVGNKAATFPLQSLGYDVWPIHTVQFSNHSGYGKFQGEIFSAGHIAKVIQGIKELGVINRCKAILSGYLGDGAIGNVILETVQELRKENPELLYLCDPVIGDVDRGIFVKDGIADFFKTQALSHASIITPNHFEAELLYGAPITTIAKAKEAARFFHSQGVNIVIFTSFRSAELPADKLHVFLSDRTNQLIAQTPLIDFKIAPNGTGDLFSALFLGNYLKSQDMTKTLARVLAQMYHVILTTYQLEQRELAVIGHNYETIMNNKTIKIKDA